MGPACAIELATAPDAATLDSIDAFLDRIGARIERTRKGRVWDVWIVGRPVHVAVTNSPDVVTVSAGCNSPKDYELLRRIARGLADILGGRASEPLK
jgi:hypothetical protein